jgi:arylamine N-acetyltransferase
MNANKSLFSKYLTLLGVAESSPSFELLKKIVKSHVIKVPFENVSKLLFKQKGMNDIPDLETFLKGIEKYNFGGTCYSNNYYLYLLLEYIGFDVKLCGADMKNPDVHLISIVKIDDREYIVDGGYAAPFLNPLPIDLTMDYVITLGGEKYIVRPKDENGKTKVEQFSNNKLKHWYTANPQPREIDELRKVISDSYAGNAVFMNAVRISKFSEGGSLVLKNLMFTETDDSKSVTKKLTRNVPPNFVGEKFGMPVNLVKQAITGIKDLRDIYD